MGVRLQEGSTSLVSDSWPLNALNYSVGRNTEAACGDGMTSVLNLIVPVCRHSLMQFCGCQKKLVQTPEETVIGNMSSQNSLKRREIIFLKIV